MQIYLRNFLSARSLIHLGMLAVVWLVLSEGIAGSWLIGLPLIILVVLFLVGAEEEERTFPVSLTGLLVFIPFFLRQSVMSGFDVALRALRPDMGLQPVLQNYRLSIPDGAPRRLFVNCITLMPGTLSVLVQEDSVLIHVLDERQPSTAALRHLETRVDAVFGAAKEVGGES